MKKTLALILIFIIIIMCFFFSKYLNYKEQQKRIKIENLEFETCLNKEIFGTEMISFINNAIDKNEKNKVPKNENGFYIQNDYNSIQIEIKIIDNNTIYRMETLYNGGMINFAQNYNSIYFECTKINYNKFGKVNYMFFEQRTV